MGSKLTTEIVIHTSKVKEGCIKEKYIKEFTLAYIEGYNKGVKDEYKIDKDKVEIIYEEEETVVSVKGGKETKSGYKEIDYEKVQDYYSNKVRLTRVKHHIYITDYVYSSIKGEKKLIQKESGKWDTKGLQEALGIGEDTLVNYVLDATAIIPFQDEYGCWVYKKEVLKKQAIVHNEVISVYLKEDSESETLEGLILRKHPGEETNISKIIYNLNMEVKRQWKSVLKTRTSKLEVYVHCAIIGLMTYGSGLYYNIF